MQGRTTRWTAARATNPSTAGPAPLPTAGALVPARSPLPNLRAHARGPGRTVCAGKQVLPDPWVAGRRGALRRRVGVGVATGQVSDRSILILSPGVRARTTGLCGSRTAPRQPVVTCSLVRFRRRLRRRGGWGSAPWDTPGSSAHYYVLRPVHGAVPSLASPSGPLADPAIVAAHSASGPCGAPGQRVVHASGAPRPPPRR